MAPIVLALEDLGAIRSIKRSLTLVKGSFWRVFGYVFVAGLVTAIIQFAVTVPFNIIGAVGNASTVNTGSIGTSGFAGLSTFGLFAQMIGSIVSLAVSIPFITLFTTYLYTELRIRNENLAPVLERSAAQRGLG